MTLAGDRHAAPELVEAPLRFLADRENVAVYVASVGGGEVPEHEGSFVMQRVSIHNGRARARAFSLDREGFVLVPQFTKVRDFYDDNQTATIYEDEVKALVERETGATRIEIFDHTRRAVSEDTRKSRLIREPASTVHNDYTAASAPKRLREHFIHTPEEAEKLLESRFAVVNVWRSIKGTVQTAPLALCDASSVAPEDLVAVTRKAKDRIGEIQMALHSPHQRWYYFPGMTMDEALLIKTFDSETDGRARFTIHTAFDDPAAPAHAPSRESIETRCFAFF
ncbi:MAG TPA: CmcJ/NvfI family oxidoreductase [Gammaproteobacteria bacterium]|nr:CmcJ/NvfI family oxidoreductase [Gammaproteobacteria bacterium]